MKAHKIASAVIVQNSSILMVRAKGKDFFISPGGAIEPGETPERALIRELQEECSVTINSDDIEPYGVFEADAKGRPGEKVSMQAFRVKTELTNLRASSEIVELVWVNSKNMKNLSIGSIFEKQIIPKLLKSGEIC